MKKDISSITEEIKNYSSSVLTTFGKVEESEITQLEDEIGLRLPEDFRFFLTVLNGFELGGFTVYGIHPNNLENDLLENYLWELNEADNPITKNLLPISPDYSGNHYCLDLDTMSEDRKQCDVVFWQHDYYNYTKTDKPDIEENSFLAFIKNLYSEIINEIDQNGNYR